MAKVNVSSEAVSVAEEVGPLGGSRLLIQNLGPGKLYMDSTSDVSANDSFEIAVGGVYETSGAGAYSSIFLISAETSDVRIVGV